LIDAGVPKSNPQHAVLLRTCPVASVTYGRAGGLNPELLASKVNVDNP